jgi:hypothetical protein
MEFEQFEALVQEAAIEVGAKTGLQFGPVVSLDEHKDFIRVSGVVVTSTNDGRKFPYATRFSISWLWLYEASVYNNLTRYFTSIAAEFKVQSGE